MKTTDDNSITMLLREICGRYDVQKRYTNIMLDVREGLLKGHLSFDLKLKGQVEN